MPAGLETFRADGSPLTRYTDKIARVFGVYPIGSGSGSFEVPQLAEAVGTRFYITTGGTELYDPGASMVSANISGTTVSWSNLGVACSIVVGIF